MTPWPIPSSPQATGAESAKKRKKDTTPRRRKRWSIKWEASGKGGIACNSASFVFPSDFWEFSGGSSGFMRFSSGFCCFSGDVFFLALLKYLLGTISFLAS